MSQESKTPRTDAEAAEAANYASIAKGWYVHADFARQLETELAAMTEERDAFMASNQIKSAEGERLRALCDDLYSDILAAASLAPQGSGAYSLLHETIRLRRDRWARLPEVGQ